MTCACEEKDKKIADLTNTVCRYINAQARHMPPAWKEFFIQEFDLIVDKVNPYEPVMPRVKTITGKYEL